MTALDRTPPLTRRHWLCTAGAALLACTNADQDHDGADAPATGELAKVPRTAWVFSSGGPRGFVHVGVIKALAELGLRPELIVGASVGSLVGVLLASGCSASEIETLALELNPVKLARLAMGARERLSGSAVADLVREQVTAKTGQPWLQSTPIPVVCVVQRLADGATVGFNRGDAGIAVQASCATSGQFAPVRIRGRQYADADLHTPLPVRLARALGATRVLAVDASAHEDRAPATALRWREGDLNKRALTHPDAQAADLLLHPDFGYFVSLSREFRERSIAAGYRETLAAAARIKALHA